MPLVASCEFVSYTVKLASAVIEKVRQQRCIQQKGAHQMFYLPFEGKCSPECLRVPAIQLERCIVWYCQDRVFKCIDTASMLANRVLHTAV